MSLIIWTDGKKKPRADQWSGKIIETPEDGVRAELRRTFRYTPGEELADVAYKYNMYSQVLLVVSSNVNKYPHVQISMNGKTPMTVDDVFKLGDVLEEAEGKIQERVDIAQRVAARKDAGLVQSPSGDWYQVPPGPNANAERELYRIACKEKNEAGMLYFEEGHTGWTHVQTYD